MGTPSFQGIPAKKPFSLIKCLWAIFKDMDQLLHARFMRAFPKALPVLDALLEGLFGIVIHPAFALIAAVLLVVLVLSGVINRIVFVSIFVAWIVAVLWIARAKPVRALTVMFRLIFIGVIGVLLGVIGNGFGNWALREYNRSKAAEHVSDKTPQLKPAPEPERPGTDPTHHGAEDKATAKVEHLTTPCTMKQGKTYTTALSLPGGPKLSRPMFELEGAHEIAWFWKNDQYLILLELTLTSRGEESIVKDWELCLLHDGKPSLFHVGEIPDEGIELSTGEKISKNTTLTEKAIREPIKHAHTLSGWVAFSVPKDLASELMAKDVSPSGSIRLKDYLAHTYSWDFVGSSNANAPKAKVYVPGYN